jgi:hypothetical protein
MYHPYWHAPQEWSQELYNLKAQQNNKNKITNLFATFPFKEESLPPPTPSELIHAQHDSKEINKRAVALKSPTGTHEHGVASQWLVL